MEWTGSLLSGWVGVKETFAFSVLVNRRERWKSVRKSADQADEQLSSLVRVLLKTFCGSDSTVSMVFTHLLHVLPLKIVDALVFKK